jgi:hypothetical protein
MSPASARRLRPIAQGCLAASSDFSSHASCLPSPHPGEGSAFSEYFKRSEGAAKVFEELGHAGEAVARVWRLATAIAIIRCNSEVEFSMDRLTTTITTTITIAPAAKFVKVAETSGGSNSSGRRIFSELP